LAPDPLTDRLLDNHGGLGWQYFLRREDHAHQTLRLEEPSLRLAIARDHLARANVSLWTQLLAMSIRWLQSTALGCVYLDVGGRLPLSDEFRKSFERGA
jgi:hypothetical protein